MFPGGLFVVEDKKILHLIASNQIPENAVFGTYDLVYVFMSYVVAVIASRIALMVLEEIDTNNFKMRIRGCLLGSLVMGAGIWSMHFTGMLAFKMEMEHHYQFGLTFLSMLFAALFSFAVFYNITREKLSYKVIAINAPIMGFGVALMHYTGMLAMDMRGETLYVSSLFWASIIIAVTASGAAMWIMRFVRESQKYKQLLGMIAALIMGLAVCGMHYTGMASTVFVPFADCRFVKDQNIANLVITVVLTSMSISLLGIYLLSQGFLKEESTKRKIFSLRGTVVTNFLIVLLGSSMAFFVYYESNQSYLYTIDRFREVESLKVNSISKSVEETMNRIYEKIKTISILTFVRNYAETPSSNPKMSDVNVLNTIGSELKDYSPISIKIVSALTKKISTQDGNTTLPKLSVDIINDSTSKGMSEYITDEEKIRINHIIEDQIKWFENKYPSNEDFKDDKVPARGDLLAPPVPNEIPVEKTAKTQDYYIVYSLPIYSEKGKFLGVISCLFTTDVFNNTFYTENSVLVITGDKEHIYPLNIPGHLRGSLAWIKKKEPDTSLLQSKVSLLSIPDGGNEWRVWNGTSDSLYFNSDGFKNIEEFRILGYSISLIMIVLALVLFNTMRRGYAQEFDRERESNKSKSEFLSNMSHELRTPMHAMLNYSSMGLTTLGENGSESLTKYFRNIQTAGNRLLILLNNLLDLAKLESGKMEFNISANDFRSVVDETLIELDSLLSKKNIYPIVQYSAINTTAHFDKNKMVQVLVNLMSNAIKFSPEESSIQITVEDVHLPSNRGAGLQCSIVDEGVGIPELEVSKVFEKFTQSSQTKTQAGGTGLGLSICKQIVEAHGGSIWAKNGKDSGAVFQFQFPLEGSRNNII